MPNYNTQGITSTDANDPRNTPTSTSSGIMSSTSNPTDNDDNEPSFFESIANFFSGAGADLPSSTTDDDDGDSGASFYDSPMFDPYDGGSDNDTTTANDITAAVDSALYEALEIDVPEVYTGMMGEEEPEPNIDMDVLQRALQPDPITVEELEVKAGDTLSDIAKDKGVPLQAVIDANPQIKNPDMIRPGEVVSIPDPRFEGVPKPRGVADSPRLSDSTVTPIEKDTDKGLMAPPAQDTAPEIDTTTAGPSTPAETGDVAEDAGLMSRSLTAEERTSLSDVGGMAAKAYLEDKGLDQDLFDSFEATSTYAKQNGWSTQKTPHVPMFTSAEKRKAMTVLDSVADSVYEDEPELVAALKTIMDHESGGKLAELGYAYLTGADLAAKINASNNPSSTPEQRSRLRALTAMENSAEYRNGDREKKDMMIFDVYYDDQHRSDGYKMGNTEEGDGSKYRGRGIIQLTGKNNYKKYGDMIGVDLVNNPDYMQNRPDVMIAASLAYLEDKGLNEGTLSARKMAKVVGHSDDPGKPEARARWDDVISSIEAAGNQALADDMRLNDEYLAQETVGATVDGIIGTNSKGDMTEWLGRPPRNITVPQGTSTLDLVRMVNMEANP
tara:strand:+ start:674 stop:2509 length:1836 start_codon:yes stop_codon:yes gene_type:complete